jgi:hypothetical protein
MRTFHHSFRERVEHATSAKTARERSQHAAAHLNEVFLVSADKWNSVFARGRFQFMPVSRYEIGSEAPRQCQSKTVRQRNASESGLESSGFLPEIRVHIGAEPQATFEKVRYCSLGRRFTRVAIHVIIDLAHIGRVDVAIFVHIGEQCFNNVSASFVVCERDQRTGIERKNRVSSGGSSMSFSSCLRRKNSSTDEKHPRYLPLMLSCGREAFPLVVNSSSIKDARSEGERLRVRSRMSSTGGVTVVAA